MATRRRTIKSPKKAGTVRRVGVRKAAKKVIGTRRKARRR